MSDTPQSERPPRNDICLEHWRHVEPSGLCVQCELAALRRELDQWTKWGIVEIAARNQQVMEWIQHHEDRTEKAEREVENLKHDIARQVQISTDLVQELEQANERLENNHYFKGGKRIECKPGSIPDGIECRNETIKLLERELEAARKERDEARSCVTQYGDAGALRALQDANDRTEKAEQSLDRAMELLDEAREYAIAYIQNRSIMKTTAHAMAFLVRIDALREGK